ALTLCRVGVPDELGQAARTADPSPEIAEDSKHTNTLREAQVALKIGPRDPFRDMEVDLIDTGSGESIRVVVVLHQKIDRNSRSELALQAIDHLTRGKVLVNEGRGFDPPAVQSLARLDEFPSQQGGLVNVENLDASTLGQRPVYIFTSGTVV